MVITCAAVVALLAVSGCTNSTPEPTASEDVVATMTTASANDADPTIPIPSSQAAGIPTAKPPAPNTPDPTTLDATALITLATVDPDRGGLLLGGYVSGVVEDGGDCQYVVTPSNGTSVTIHTDGVENNGSTSCGSTTVSSERVPPGRYTVVLRYVNDVGQVDSDAVTVDVS